MIEGIFFDGERSTALPARMELAAPGVVHLSIEDPLETRHWEGRLLDLELSERIGNIPRRAAIPGLGVFETPDNDAIDRALAEVGRPFELVHWLEARWPVAIAALVAVAVGSFLFVRIGVPAIADLAARTLPPAADRAIGARTLELLDDRLLHPTELPRERQDELRRRFAVMTTDSPGELEERLELRAAPALGPNALALPSGIVVMTDELVALAEHDDELVAVLAHELGHVRGRHALRRLFQSISVSALAFALIGDVSSASALFSAVPVLIEAKHSRDFEREADDFAKAWLVRQGIPPFRFDEILCRMEGGQGNSAGRDADDGDALTRESESGTAESTPVDVARERPDGWSRYLSTHPTTDERARCAKSSVPSDHRADVWQDMREDVSRSAREALNAPASPRTGPPPSRAAPGS